MVIDGCATMGTRPNLVPRAPTVMSSDKVRSAYEISKRKRCLRAKWPIRAGAYPGFCGMKRLGVFLLPPRWDTNSSQGYPQHFAATHLYNWVERGTVRVKCLAQEHNTMSPARTRTRTRSIRSREIRPLQKNFYIMVRSLKQIEKKKKTG